MNTPVALRNGTDWPPGAPKAHGTASYRCQAKRLLRNSFPRISCAAIDLVLRFYDYNFTNSFTTLSQIENRRAGTDGDGTGLFPIIPNHTKVFIKSVRRKEAFVLNDELLRDEIDAIPELNTKDGVEADDAGGINQANNGNNKNTGNTLSNLNMSSNSSKKNFSLLHSFKGHTKGVTAIHLHPISGLAISASLDGMMRVLNLEALNELFSIQVGCGILGMRVVKLCNNNFGCFASLCDGTIKLWKITSVCDFFAVASSKISKLDIFENLEAEKNSG